VVSEEERPPGTAKFPKRTTSNGFRLSTLLTSVIPSDRVLIRKENRIFENPRTDRCPIRAEVGIQKRVNE